MIFRILRNQLSYQKVAVIIGRLIIIEFLLLGFSILTVSKTYKTYYNHTFLPSQTVNHDILFPTLPLALSYAMANNQTKDITRILNSNYGLWQLVITDEEGKEIINYSDKNIKNQSNWLEQISNEHLQKYPYHLILKPSIIKANNSNLDFPENHITDKKIINPDLILGRVYYVNKISANFQEELAQWLQNPFEKNNRFPIYNLTMLLFVIAGLLVWSFLEFFLTYRLLMIREKKQLSRRIELEQALLQREREKKEIAYQNQILLKNKQLELKKEIYILQSNLQEKINQNLYLIKQREKEQKELQTLEKYQTEQIQNLEDTINEYEQEIVILEGLQEQSQELEIIIKEKDNLLRQLKEQKKIEKQSKKQIELLKDKIHLLIIEKDEAEHKIKDLQSIQISNKISLQEREEVIQKEFERQINLLKLESQYAFEEAQIVEDEKDKLILQNKQLKDSLNSAIEKNKYLELAVEKYKRGINYIKNEPEINHKNRSIPTSYLTNISSKKAIKALKKLGFEKDRYHGDHIILKKAESKTVPIPHPRQELNPLTLKNILMQTDTSLEDFLNNL